MNYFDEMNNYLADNLQDAKVSADKDAAYSQRDIVISDESGNEISRRKWYGYKFDADDEPVSQDEVIQFSDFGFYGPWSDTDD